MHNRQNSNQPANWRYLPSFLRGLFVANTPSATASINILPPLSAAAAAADATSTSAPAALTAPSIAVDQSLDTAASSSTVLIDAEQSNESFTSDLQLDDTLHEQNPAASAFVLAQNNHYGAVADIVSLHLSRQLLPKHQSQLAKTCHYFHSIFQPGLNRLAEAKAYELLQHVIHGDQDAAEEILKVNPGILLWSSSINTEKDKYTNRPEIMENATAFQAALRLGDVEMWQMMEKYFKQIRNGDIEKSKQFYAEFPDGEPIAQQPYDLSCLVDIISASDADVQAQLWCVENESALCQAINIFRYDFAECSMNEKHFNPEHLINALTVYDAQFDRWSWNQLDLFCRQVFGYMQRYMPACYAQAFAQGIYYITEEREALRRSFDYRVGAGHILPLDSDPALRLGYEIYAGPGRGVCAWRADGGAGSRVKKLCQAKTAALGELKQRVQNPESGLESSQCVIS